MFRKWFQHAVCIHIEWIWSEIEHVNKQIFQIWTKYKTITLGFAENGQFSNKKGLEKLN